jgi:hypothetical protein
MTEVPANADSNLPISLTFMKSIESAPCALYLRPADTSLPSIGGRNFSAFPRRSRRRRWQTRSRFRWSRYSVCAVRIAGFGATYGVRDGGKTCANYCGPLVRSMSAHNGITSRVGCATHRISGANSRAAKPCHAPVRSERTLPRSR